MSKALWTGRILSAIVGTAMLAAGVNALIGSPDVLAGFVKFGYPENTLRPIGIAALISAVLYLIPRTAVLGAILLTGYLGGAVATHARISDPLWVVPVTVGVLIWLGIYLRMESVRALLPLTGSRPQ